MNLRSIDLRLLVVFDTVMQERNVTRAGMLLGMSQPAVTGSLNRLRELLGDQLFVRVTGGVRPTPHAESLAQPIHNALIQLESALEPSEFSPADSEHVFTIASSLHMAMIIVEDLTRILSDMAPNARLRLLAKNNNVVFDQLRSGEVDLAVGVHQEVPAQIRQLELFSDTYVCVMRKGHQLAGGPLTAEEYVHAAHLDISHGGESDHYLDRNLSIWRERRRTAYTIGQTILAPRVLENSDLLFTMLSRLVPELPGIDRLHVQPLPIEVPPVPISMAWHEIVDDHAPHRWLREQIMGIVRSRTGSIS